MSRECNVACFESFALKYTTFAEGFRSHPSGGHTVTGRKEAELQKTYLLTCVPSEDSDQHAHSRSLIRIFTGHILDIKAAKFLTGTMKTLMRMR